jgi:competence protein ComEA
MSRADRIYLSVTTLLVIAAIAGGVKLAMQPHQSQPLEIVLSQIEPPTYSGQLHIGGAVANPGVYAWQEDDTIQALLLAAGPEAEADLSQIRLHVPRVGEEVAAQKIDINRAEPWLLEALPGIGEVRAQAIVAYRSEHGPFTSIEALLDVSGIGASTFERIRDLITTVS